MKKYRFTILTGVLYIIYLEIFFWGAANNWQVNDWIKGNAIIFAVFGWGIPGIVSAYESLRSE